MKNKKGFTLIELLAIIVILAIIAVITVPIILNIIDNSKKGAIVDSAYGYKDAINKYYLEKLTDNSNYRIPNETYTVNEQTGYLIGTTTLEIKISGQKPSSGSVQIENNDVKQACLIFDGYAIAIVDGKVGEPQEGTCDGLETTSQNETPLPIGTVVNYSTSLNNVDLTDWRVFYSESDYTYLIYGNYFPGTAVNIENITVSDNNVCTLEGRKPFVNAFLNKSNWNNLVTNGKINDIAINQEISENIWAIGTPDIELWTKSYNTSYPNDKIQIGKYALTDEDGINVHSFTYPQNTHLENELYFPTVEYIAGEGYDTNGYWLSSFYGTSTSDFLSTIITIDTLDGEIDTDDYYYCSWTIRPIISLPTSLVKTGAVLTSTTD